LNDLFFRLKTVRGVTVVAAAIPISGLMRQECTVVGDDLAARDVLLQILEQVGALSSPKIRFAWGLFYDANGDKYFLSTIPVPDMTPLGTEAQGQQANKTALPVTATPPTSGNRTGVPASKK
jgi:hypothetical protein